MFYHNLNKKLYLLIIFIFCSGVTLNSAADAQKTSELLLRLQAAHPGYHRGNTDVAQENSKAAIIAVLDSAHPHVEVDITSFKDNGKEVGLLVHENNMDRITDLKGNFQDIKQFNKLPQNQVNPQLPAEPLLSVVDFFELIQQYAIAGKNPLVSLDIKVEEDGFAFGQWLGNLIQQYGFENRIFSSDFRKDSLTGIKNTCSHCLTGGVIFKTHWALRFLDTKYSSLDITPMSKLGFFLGFPGKKKFPHDFVLFHDEIFFNDPELADYWRDERAVKFVGIFTQAEHGTYSPQQWRLIKEYNIKWMELAPEQVASLPKN